VQKRKKNDTNYSTPMPSGGPQTIDGGTYDTSESEARRAWVQRAST
jgi:hypothetical protein